MFSRGRNSQGTPVAMNTDPVTHPYDPDSYLDPRSVRSVVRLDESPFMRSFGRKIWIHGVVTDIRSMQQYRDKTHKLIDTFIGDEPHDFAHTTVEYALRVNALPSADGMPSSECIDVRLYGNYLGGFSIGDELKITGKRYLLLRKIAAKKVYNLTTGCSVTPELQIPAGLAKLPLNLVILGVLFLFILGLINTEGGAALLSMIGVLLVLCIPPAAIIYLIWSKKSKGGR